VVASAVVVRAARVDHGVVGGRALLEPLSSTPVGEVCREGRSVVIGCRGGVEMTVSRLRRFRSPCGREDACGHWKLRYGAPAEKG
jgi:hypothetical protein